MDRLTVFKTYFSAAWSRTGRKGPYAAYYVQIQPNGGSFVGEYGPSRTMAFVVISVVKAHFCTYRVAINPMIPDVDRRRTMAARSRIPQKAASRI